MASPFRQMDDRREDTWVERGRDRSVGGAGLGRSAAQVGVGAALVLETLNIK